MSGADPSVSLENSIGSIPEGLLEDAMNVPMAGLREAMNGGSGSTLGKPRMEIVEQPKSRGFRFRYDCEGQSHGGLPGENSERNKKQKTYPTVRLIGYRGRARVMVSLVSDTDPPVPHAHSIVGKNAVDGRCILEIGPETDMYAQFPNLGILHVTKKKVPDVLCRRLIQQIQMKDRTLEQLTDQPTNLSEEDISQIKAEAQSISKTMNLSVVRLCFQAFLMDKQGRFTIPVEPVFTHKVYDSKAPSAGTLKICRLDRTSGSVKGGDDVFLLCDKVQKNDIEVLFYEERHDSGMNPLQPWQAKGRFGPNDVHHQYAIVFQTPPFYNQAIERQVQVFIALRRPSDQELSEPKPFTYLPQEYDEERIGAKRKKRVQHFDQFFGGPGGQSFGGNFFKGMSDIGGSFGSPFGGFFSGSGGGTGSSGGGSNQATFGGTSSNSAGYPGAMNLPGFEFSNSQPSYSNHDLHMPDMSDLSLSTSVSGPSFGSVGSAQPFYDQQSYSHPQYRPDLGRNVGAQLPHPHHQPQPQPQPQQQPGMYQQPHDDFASMFQTRGGLKPERIDPAYGDVEMDKATHQPRPSGSQMPPGHRPPEMRTLTVPDYENDDSAFAELEGERLDSGLPKSTTDAAADRDRAAEIEAQAAMQALRDRQQAGFAVCERMFNALLAWATTRDVRYLLAAQRSLTAVQNQEGDTALHLAIIHNHQDVVLELLDVLPQLPPAETPVVDCLNHYRQSPLHLAVLTRQHRVVQYLLKANANPLVCDRDGNTPLHLACKMNFVEGAVALLNRTNHINATGCRIPEMSVRNCNGQTPVHLAVSANSRETVKLLVETKADINVQDSKSGKTALHYSIEKGNLPMAGYLLTETSVNPNCCDFSGNSPLHVAAGLGKGAIVSLLLAAGAKVGLQNAEGETPLQMAEYIKLEEVAKLLREAMQQAGVGLPEDALASQMESVSIKAESDLSALTFRTRISLALLLDPAREGADWRELCKRVDLADLAPGLSAMTSPTKELLSMYEACDGTVGNLRQVLMAMNRMDAVNIIDRAMMENQGEPTLTMVASKPTPKPRSKAAPVFSSENVIPRTLLDSGLGSQSSSEELGATVSSPVPPKATESYSTLATTHA